MTSGPDDGSGLEQAWRSRSRPDNEVPVSLALDALIVATGDLAVFVCGMAVYRNGIEFTIEVRARPSRPTGDEDLVSNLVQGRRGEHRFLVGVEYADGRRCANIDELDVRNPGPPTQPHLQGGGGSGGGNEASATWFLTPLPPPGELRLYCAWPAVGIDETVTSLDADRILEAATRVRELWPWEPTIRRPRPPAPPVIPAEGWFAGFRRRPH